MLAVVPLGHRGELALLERARAISGEHGARLMVIGTWAPSWWFCLCAGAGSDAAAILLCLRQTSERRLTDFAARAGIDLRLRLDCEQIGRAVDHELRRDRYGYVVGRRADLPRRLVRQWRTRDPALSVIRV